MYFLAKVLVKETGMMHQCYLKWQLYKSYF